MKRKRGTKTKTLHKVPAEMAKALALPSDKRCTRFGSRVGRKINRVERQSMGYR